MHFQVIYTTTRSNDAMDAEEIEDWQMSDEKRAYEGFRSEAARVLEKKREAGAFYGELHGGKGKGWSW